MDKNFNLCRVDPTFALLQFDQQAIEITVLVPIFTIGAVFSRTYCPMVVIAFVVVVQLN